jgi:hypothetical protein
MDISKQINKELDEVKAVLMETLKKKKTGARQAAPGKTDTRTTRDGFKRVPLMKESQRGGATASMGTLFQTWGVAFKNKMIYTAMQRLSPKGRCNLVSAEQLQMMMNSKEFK